MKLQIVSVHNHGDFDKEYVLLRATEDCDVGHFALADTTYAASGNVSNKLRHFFWFPDKLIKKGDLATLWTKPGTTRSTTSAGTPMHHFYWGLKTAVWNNDGDVAVLLYAPEWQVKKAR